MKIVFQANGRCASAVVEPRGQPITAGSRGIAAEISLSADYNGLVVYVVCRSSSATRDMILGEDQRTVTVPWEVTAKPSLTFDVGVVGKNGDGTVVIPTIWARVGKIVPATEASGIDPEDPSADIGTQIVSEAREAARAAEAAERSAESFAADADESSLTAEAWAVGERRGAPVPASDPAYNNNARHYADVAAQHAQHAGYIFTDVDDQTGQLLVTTTDHLAGELQLSVDEPTGTLEVII